MNALKVATIIGMGMTAVGTVVTGSVNCINTANAINNLRKESSSKNEELPKEEDEEA